MEGKRSLVVLLFFFVIASIGLGGYIIYDKLLSVKGNDAGCPKCEACNCANNSNCMDAIEPGEQLISTELGEIFISLNGDVYFEPNENMSQFAKSAFGSSGNYEPKSDKFPSPVSYVFSYKLNLTEVHSAIDVEFGNVSGNYSVIFVHNDGSVSELSYYAKNSDDSGNITLYKNVSGYTNIVAAVPDSDYDSNFAKLYDNCGNGIKYQSQ